MVNNQLAIKKVPLDKYDKEWVNLIVIAKQYGLSPNEVREFLHKETKKGNTIMRH